MKIPELHPPPFDAPLSKSACQIGVISSEEETAIRAMLEIKLRVRELRRELDALRDLFEEWQRYRDEAHRRKMIALGYDVD